MSNSLTESNHFISLEKAREMTRQFHDMHDKILLPDYQGQDILATAETFDRAAFDTLLAKPGCAGIRIYSGMDKENKLHSIIVAVDEQNRDIINTGTATTISSADTVAAGTTSDPSVTEPDADPANDDFIVDAGLRCPPDCPPDSPILP